MSGHLSNIIQDGNVRQRSAAVLCPADRSSYEMLALGGKDFVSEHLWHTFLCVKSPPGTRPRRYVVEHDGHIGRPLYLA